MILNLMCQHHSISMIYYYVLDISKTYGHAMYYMIRYDGTNTFWEAMGNGNEKSISDKTIT